MKRDKKWQKRELGVLAQQVETHFRFAVSEKTVEEDTLYVNYAAMNIHLLEAVQALHAKNMKLDDALFKAKTKLNYLTAQLSTKQNL